MPNYWILKTEPTTYSYGDLVRDKSTAWDGVKNNLALKHIKQMSPGDEALIYHSGKEKAAVGLARIKSVAYPDPGANDPKLFVMDIEAAGGLSRPVTLKEIKADPAFKDLALVRMPRLSVVPATAAQWKRLLKLAGSPD
jgi:predicted RNA-binding protein with PUA-like domain